MSDESPLEFRPHHFLCTLGFEGKGYSDEFVRGFSQIADRLRSADGSGDSLRIRVTEATDSICAPCPNRRGELCATEDKIRQLDQGHAQVLGLRRGEVLTWGEAKMRLSERMTDESFERVCAPAPGNRWECAIEPCKDFEVRNDPQDLRSGGGRHGTDPRHVFLDLCQALEARQREGNDHRSGRP